MKHWHAPCRHHFSKRIEYVFEGDTVIQSALQNEQQPFVAFAQSVTRQTGMRAAITNAYRVPEVECIPGLIAEARLPDREAIRALATKLVQALRKKQTGGGVESLIHEFALSTQEGVALMCLAEALLRIPDTATRDALIRDKISQGNWQAYLGESSSLFVNAATWGLMVTGKLVSTSSERNLSAALTRLIAKGGEPLIRRAVDTSMRLMGEHFVAGETIKKALAHSRRYEARGFTYSYDMLGEAAVTADDAQHYLNAYQDAIHAIGIASAGRGIYEGPGISIKLSALHPRYSRAQKERVMTELLPRVQQLAHLCRHYDIGLNIDAEEADRLDISLDVLEALCRDEALAGWNGIGFVVQAYQKRAPYVVNYLIGLGRRTGHRLMVRLVKGAYWDTEIKRAQIDGLRGYPVFTRKVHTDVCYLACAKRLLAAPDAVFPQFATHNAHTLAAIYHLAGPSYYAGQYEFQCLHGMGEPLYEEVVGEVAQGKLARPCRIYAPVGTHDTLLAYLVRRLLENGANTSFVNRLAETNVSVEELTEDPVEVASRVSPPGLPHERIPLPRDIYSAQGVGARLNSKGLDLSDEHQLVELAESLTGTAHAGWRAAPTVTHARGFEAGRARPVLNPADGRDVVGQVVYADDEAIEAALRLATDNADRWAATPVNTRAGCLLRAAHLLEERMQPLVGLIVRESGKSLSNAISEVREAVDFLRYYALHIQRDFSNESHRPLGPVVCISPWNFPLAIFMGQTAAALAAGNTVLAKPAEQTSLIGAQGIQILQEAGVPAEVVQLMPGDGEVGGKLVADARVRGVMFTGSTEVAQLIARTLAQRLNPDGSTVPFVAETGGQNAMVVDSSALPEQVVIDVLLSAFDSAGQRCSALRVLCLQEEVADRLLEMVKGAMRELTLGRPDHLRVDVGPVIDVDAKDNIERHIEAMRARGFAITQAALAEDCSHGTFVPPTLIEIDTIRTLEREVFGPVLHVVRYRRTEVDRLVGDINSTGYGLTFGVHSRIDESIAELLHAVKVGNMYVNRNMIGAVVGVQPFGGERLSGTGPKAGGPLYLPRLLRASPPVRPAGISGAATESLQPLDEYIEWLQQSGYAQAADLCQNMRAHSLLDSSMVLAGPTGERNSYALTPRGPVLCMPQTELGAQVQLGAALATGNQAIFPLKDQPTHAAAAFLASLPAHLSEHADRVSDAVIGSDDEPYPFLSAALFEGDLDALKAFNQRMAAREGPIVLVQGLTPEAIARGKTYRLERLLAERSVSINTAAAGGNASLMTIG